MWATIEARKPDALFLLGDNVYFDDPTHQLSQDFIYHRHQSQPEWRPLVAQTPVYAISADRHRVDVRRTKRPDGYDLYDIMSSRLTNVHTHGLVKDAKGSEYIMGSIAGTR
jgi:hypothetical protein